MPTSKKGNAWDNAVMERFFKTLKVERVAQVRYDTPAQARLDIVDWSRDFYNRARIRSTDGYLAPSQGSAASWLHDLMHVEMRLGRSRVAHFRGWVPARFLSERTHLSLLLGMSPIRQILGPTG